MNGIDRILAERKRQIEVEGWSQEWDDRYTKGELLRAAQCYLTNDHTDWPFDLTWWKPGLRSRDLEKAGALVQAEIERLQRMRLRIAVDLEAHLKRFV